MNGRPSTAWKKLPSTAKLGVPRFSGSTGRLKATLTSGSDGAEVCLPRTYGRLPWYCWGTRPCRRFRRGLSGLEESALQRKLLTALVCLGLVSFCPRDGSSAAIGAAEPDGGRERVVPSRHGHLAIEGNRLVNARGEPVWLRGMSTHGLQWYAESLNAESAAVLAEQWRADVVRLSMYVTERGYNSNPARFRDLLDEKIRLLVEHDFYIIIDWHMLNPGDPDHEVYSGADEFFAHVAGTYGHLPNIIYEICNEPSRVRWDAIKAYADRIVGVIRPLDAKNIIVVGTPDWSSLAMSGDGDYQAIIDNPVLDPVPGQSNIMYSFHFYAASHRFARYGRAVEDFSAHLPVFVTECGTQEYTGDGRNDFAEADKYFDLFDRAQISWVNWNFSHDRRSGAVLRQAGDYHDLKEAGVYIRSRIAAPPAY